MWNNQEILYQIRKMTYQQFQKTYKPDMKKLYLVLKKCCDLNIQRNQLIDEIDQHHQKWLKEIYKCIPKLNEDGRIISKPTKTPDFEKLLQRKHKSYAKKTKT